MVKLFSHPGTLGIRLGYGEVFFRVGQAPIEGRNVEIRHGDGFLGENDDLFGIDLSKAAAHEEPEIRGRPTGYFDHPWTKR